MPIKERIGTVVSNKMDKTIVVAVESRFKSPIYSKFKIRTKRYLAHDEFNKCNIGDQVLVSESRLTAAESDSESFSTELTTLQPGQRYRLSLTLDGTAKPGRVTEEITLRAKPPLEEPLRVTANTLIRERVYTFPDGIDMGALPIEVARDADAVQTLSQILMIYRLGTDDFEVQASLDTDSISMVSERGPDGDRYQLTLTLIPEKVVPGRIEGSVRIKTNDSDFSELEVPISGYILD